MFPSVNFFNKPTSGCDEFCTGFWIWGTFRVQGFSFIFHGLQVNGRIIRKRLHVRVEHVVPSRCDEAHIERKKKNDELVREAQAKGERVDKLLLKRQPAGPKPGFVVEGQTMETVTAVPYDVVNDLKGGY